MYEFGILMFVQFSSGQKAWPISIVVVCQRAVTYRHRVLERVTIHVRLRLLQLPTTLSSRLSLISPTFPT